MGLQPIVSGGRAQGEAVPHGSPPPDPSNRSPSTSTPFSPSAVNAERFGITSPPLLPPERIKTLTANVRTQLLVLNPATAEL